MSIVALGSPYEALQTAWRTRLVAASQTSGYTLYDEAYIPQDAAFPYLAFGRFSSTFAGSNSTSGTDVRAEIRVIDRATKGFGGRGSVYDRMDGIVRATTATQLVSTGDWKIWDARPEFDEVIFLEDATHVYTQGILRFRFRMQFVGTVSPASSGGTMVTQSGLTMQTQDGTSMETQ